MRILDILITVAAKQQKNVFVADGTVLKSFEKVLTNLNQHDIFKKSPLSDRIKLEQIFKLIVL